MIHTERVQRLLFRMLHDPGFAAAFLRGDAEEWPRLTPREARLFATLDPRRLQPLPDDKTRRQTLGNLLAEYPVSFHSAPEGRGLPDALLGFFATPAFHAAIEDGRPLPLCFADYWQARGESAGPEHRALCRLEVEIVRARRLDAGRPAGKGLRLAPAVRLLVLPEGTLDLAEAMRRDLNAGRSPRGIRGRLGPGNERVMLLPLPALSSFREVELRVEKLEEALAGLLFLAADQAIDSGPGLRYARSLGAETAEYDALVAQLQDEGILARA